MLDIRNTFQPTRETSSAHYNKMRPIKKEELLGLLTYKPQNVNHLLEKSKRVLGFASHTYTLKRKLWELAKEGRIEEIEMPYGTKTTTYYKLRDIE